MSMVQNPIVQVVMLFVGAYYALSTLERIWPPLGPLVTAVAAALAGAIWLLDKRSDLATRLYHSNSIVRSFLDLVCTMTKRQPPVAATSPLHEEDPEHGVLDWTDYDFDEAERRLGESIRGHDDVVAGLLEQLRRSVRLRARSDDEQAHAPLGIYLFIGSAGLGKRTLAELVGALACPRSGATSVNFAEDGDHIGALMHAVRTRPHQVLILENVDRVDDLVSDRLQAIVSGCPLQDPETGAVVDFRSCLVFLIAHKPADEVKRLKAGGTLLAGMMAEKLGLPLALVSYVHDYFSFVLPDQLAQVDVVALMMEQECRRYNVRLSHVDPEILAKEARIVGSVGGFSTVPARVAKLLKGPILDAVARNDDAIRVHAPQA